MNSLSKALITWLAISFIGCKSNNSSKTEKQHIGFWMGKSIPVAIIFEEKNAKLVNVCGVVNAEYIINYEHKPIQLHLYNLQGPGIDDQEVFNLNLEFISENQLKITPTLADSEDHEIKELILVKKVKNE